MSVGFRDWLARKMMQELVKVKQNQANIVKYLLTSVTSQGLAYFTELERLNSEDTARNMERMRHTHVRSDYRAGHHSSGYPTSQGSQTDSVYAKVTNVNNNANIPSDSTGQAPTKTPVYRIRSLPQTGEDDTIMITTPTAEMPAGSLEVQQARRSPRSPRSHSRQHAPLPPVPTEDIDSVYSLAQAVSPTQPLSSPQRSSRQNAPLPPPPSIAKMSSAHIITEGVITNSDSVSELHVEYDDEAEEVYDDTSSRTAPGEKTACHPTSPLVRRSGTSQMPQSSGIRKNSPLPPLPPLLPVDFPDTNKQTMFTKHVDSETAASTNRASPKQQMLTGAPAQPLKQSLEANMLSVTPRPRRVRSRSPSPPVPAVSSRSQGIKHKSATPSPPPPQVLEKIHTSSSSSSELPEPTIRHCFHRPLASTRGAKCYSTSQISSSTNNGEEAPPMPPPRKVSAPVESTHPPVGEECVSDTHSMPPVPPRKTSGGKPNVDPGAPPLPSRKIVDNSESSSMPLLFHRTPDTSEPIAPPLPSREVIKDQTGSPGKRPTRRNATRTKSSESLTSLPEEEKESQALFASLAEGIFSRNAMQRKLHGLLRAPTRNRATSNQFSGRVNPKVQIGQRLSDPSNQRDSDKNRIPIHKTPLPPIPVQIHTSASAPQMVVEDVPQDVYEDLDKACELINQDVPQFEYEDLDIQKDKPQDHYEDIDMDDDKPQDHYEDIDYDMEDRPQEVYEDINSEAAQRVSFAMTGVHVPQDYTPPIVRSMAYSEEDEPQDYTPPIRRGGAHVEVDEPQDYTPPIRRSRMCVDDGDEDEPQEYTPPIVRRSVIVDNQSLPPAPPLPPRSASREPHDRCRGHRAPVTVIPPVSPTSTRNQPDQHHQASSPSQQKACESTPLPVSPPTKSRARSRSPVPPPVSRSHAEALSPSRLKAPPQSTSVGVPPPPICGDAPPPPPPPAIGHKALPPVSSPVHSSGTSTDILEETDNEPPSELLSGIRNVQLKKASERKLPQKAPPPVSSGSSTASLFAEMQSFQLRKTKHPNINADAKPSQTSTNSSSAPTAPFHVALRSTKSVGQLPPKPAPRTKPPAPVRPKPNRIPPPALKPKPAHLLPSKQTTSTTRASPVHMHSNGHVMLKSGDKLGVPATS